MKYFSYICYMKNQIYFYQDKFGPIWIKVHLVNNSRIVYIYSNDIRNIENVPVDKYEDFLDCAILSRYDDQFIKNESDLSKEYTQEERYNRSFDLFDSDQEEIDGDFNGDFSLWLRYYKYRFEYRPTTKYIRSDYNRSCEFKYTNNTIDKFLDNYLLIPYEEVINDYPSLNYKGLTIGVKLDSSEMVEIRRDQEIKKLLSLQLI